MLTSAVLCCQALAGLLRPDGGRMQVAGPRSFVFQNPDHQVQKLRWVHSLVRYNGMRGHTQGRSHPTDNAKARSTLLILSIFRLHGLRVGYDVDEVASSGWLQVVMPTVGADVAFGLGRHDLPHDEIRRRVADALQAVGMEEYLEVGEDARWHSGIGRSWTGEIKNYEAK